MPFVQRSASCNTFKGSQLQYSPAVKVATRPHMHTTLATVDLMSCFKRLWDVSLFVYTTCSMKTCRLAGSKDTVSQIVQFTPYVQIPVVSGPSPDLDNGYLFILSA